MGQSKIERNPLQTAQHHITSFCDQVNKMGQAVMGQAVTHTKTARDSVYKLGAKIKEVAVTHLTPPQLAQKTKNALYAKVFPLSSPAGWDEQHAKALEIVEKRLRIKTRIEGQLAKKGLKECDRATLEQRLTRITKSLERAKKIVANLEKDKQLTVQNRVVSLVGTATNVAVPGAGQILGVASTAITTALQEKGAKELPKDEAGEKICKQIRNRTFCALASTVAILATKYLVYPYVQKTFASV